MQKSVWDPLSHTAYVFWQKQQKPFFSRYEMAYKYAKVESTVEKKRGLNRVIVKNLSAFDEIYLSVNSDSAIVTNALTPFRFIGYELVWKNFFRKNCVLATWQCVMNFLNTIPLHPGESPLPPNFHDYFFFSLPIFYLTDE